jgi:hypothetical protein
MCWPPESQGVENGKKASTAQSRSDIRPLRPV